MALGRSRRTAIPDLPFERPVEKRRRWERHLIISVAPLHFFVPIFLNALDSYFQSFLQLPFPGLGGPYRPYYHGLNLNLQLRVCERLRRS